MTSHWLKQIFKFVGCFWLANSINVRPAKKRRLLIGWKHFSCFDLGRLTLVAQSSLQTSALKFILSKKPFENAIDKGGFVDLYKGQRWHHSSVWWFSATLSNLASGKISWFGWRRLWWMGNQLTNGWITSVWKQNQSGKGQLIELGKPCLARNYLQRR